MTIQKKLSDIFGFNIGVGEFRSYLSKIDTEGEPSRKHMAEIICALVEEIEDLHKLYDTKYEGRKSSNTLQSSKL